MQKDLKLSLCLIVKNEAGNLPKLLKPDVLATFDEIVITDTGSTDTTESVCRELCGDKLRWSTFEWCNDFAKARNFNFAQATGDWLVWADADDEILNVAELKNIAKWCSDDNINSVVFPYHYVVDEHGNILALQQRERLVRRGTEYKWIGRLHEALLPISQLAKAVKLESVVWVHHPGATRVENSKFRNLEILKSALSEEIEKDAVDPRTLFNLGNAHFSIGEYQQALACYLKYIPMSGWREERYLARHRAALAFFEMRQYEQAIEAAMTAIQEVPQYPDAYIDIGKAYFEMHDYEKALYWLQESSKKPLPEGLPVYNPLDYTANVAWLIGHCYVQMTQYRKARPFFETFLTYYPESKEAKNILEIIDKGAEEADIIHAIKSVGEYLDNDSFWAMVPKKIMEYPEVMHTKNKKVRKTESSGKDLAIYCGACLTEWDTTSAKNGGIGGSEEAVINLSRLMVERGWNVTVYGRPITEGVQEGVNYKHYTDFNPNDKYDVFISWRMPSVLAVKINASHKYVWLHDCTPEDNFTPDILNNLDKIMVLSKYHRSLYPRIPEEKFMYFGNGIDPTHFSEPVTKDPMRCIYTSAPDRGLECLLKLWPQIKEKVPDATFEWYYGWETFDELHKDNKEKMAWKSSILELLKQPGVTDGGRVDHPTIAKKYASSQLWLYPTEFTETYCITAAKAQAAGALPVCTQVAALDETVAYGTKLPYNNIYTNPDAQRQFVETVVGYLQDPSTVDLERAGMQGWALEHFAWSHMADKWNNEL